MREKGLCIFLYQRSSRSDAVTALKEAGIGYGAHNYRSKREVEGNTPRYVLYGVAEDAYRRFLQALERNNAQGVEVYWE